MPYHAVIVGGETYRSCIVVSYNGQNQVTSINLYSDTETGFKHFHAFFAPELDNERSGRLKNEDPSDHDAIHDQMAELMGTDRETTKHRNRHYHYVCRPPMSFGDFVKLVQPWYQKSRQLSGKDYINLCGHFMAST
jgi:hypothetical protein